MMRAAFADGDDVVALQLGAFAAQFAASGGHAEADGAVGLIFAAAVDGLGAAPRFGVVSPRHASPSGFFQDNSSEIRRRENEPYRARPPRLECEQHCGYAQPADHNADCVLELRDETHRPVPFRRRSARSAGVTYPGHRPSWNRWTPAARYAESTICEQIWCPVAAMYRRRPGTGIRNRWAARAR